MNKKFSNAEIYGHSAALIKLFGNDNQNYFSAEINFIIQKNKNMLRDKAIEIEQARLEIIQKYGHLSEEDSNQFVIPPEKVEIVNQELADLLSIEQELNILTIKIDDLDKVEFTPAQMEVLMFMIEEE